MRSIGEQAQQLTSLAGQIPTARFAAIDTALGKIAREIQAILGETPSAGEIGNLVQRIQGQVHAATQGLSQLEKSLIDLSAHHQRG
ncbi:hypothetical protein [Actinokineospora iranica]|uniref:Uncharacterized protein n=1 Tax=Actinokineospora iranica TaxID=1271860 RepID=A0A1G6T870_9PSEU|nr:hypothetical protein [Actinokineospora iranica]SDD25241.1 hypothetical protein SAMN05216174_10919 [Actinokineospora iranica]